MWLCWRRDEVDDIFYIYLWEVLEKKVARTNARVKEETQEVAKARNRSHLRRFFLSRHGPVQKYVQHRHEWNHLNIEMSWSFFIIITIFITIQGSFSAQLISLSKFRTIAKNLAARLGGGRLLSDPEATGKGSKKKLYEVFYALWYNTRTESQNEST